MGTTGNVKVIPLYDAYLLEGRAHNGTLEEVADALARVLDRAGLADGWEIAGVIPNHQTYDSRGREQGHVGPMVVLRRTKA